MSYARSMVYVSEVLRLLLLISIYLQLEFVRRVSDARTLGIKCREKRHRKHRHRFRLLTSR